MKNFLIRKRPLRLISPLSNSTSRAYFSSAALQYRHDPAVRLDHEGENLHDGHFFNQDQNVLLEKFNNEVKPIESDPLSVIRWAAETFKGRIAMSTSFGIQSSVLLHMATQVFPQIPVVFVDTGYLPKETYLYAEELKNLFNLNLIISTNDQMSPARMEALHGKLWEMEDEKSHNLYGKLRKVDPMLKALQNLNPTPFALLSGLRSTQTKARSKMSQVTFDNSYISSLNSKNPVVKRRFKVLPQLKMTDEDVEKYMDMFDLPQHPLRAKGYATVGDWHSSRPVQAGEDARDTRFGGKFQECGLHVDIETDAASSASNTTTLKKTAQAEEGAEKSLPSLEKVVINSDTELAIVMVKKVNEDGSFCRKCKDVAAKISKDGLEDYINLTTTADLRDPTSEGMVLAKSFDVQTAPFFLVRDLEMQERNEEFKVVRSYLQLKKMIETALENVEAKRKETLEGEKDSEIKMARKYLEEMEKQVEKLEKEKLAVEKKMRETKDVFYKKFPAMNNLMI